MSEFLPCRVLRWLRLLACAALLAVPGAALSQGPRLIAYRCAAPPKLDCDPKDPAWIDCPAASPFKDAYTDRTDVDQTEAKLAYDEKAIYVLFVCRDSQPDRIVGREITPEAQFNGEDTVTFSIDTFHTRSGASLSRFTVNAINTQNETIAGGHSSKAEWRGIWSSNSKRTTDGYVVEMRIPWKILNYPTRGKPIDMDLNFARFQARTMTNSQWAYTTPSFKPELLGVLVGVIPPVSDERSKLQFLAYDAPGIENGALSNRAGIDSRYQVSARQTALLSVNPDFVNIEQQIAGISFVHTERFLLDARPFFTEGGDYFNPVGTYEYGIPFYSQRIGPINVGSKFYGQMGPNGKLGTLAVDQSDGSKATFTNYQTNLGSTFVDSVYASSYDGTTHDRMIGDALNKRWGTWFVNFDGALESAERSNESAGDFALGYTGAKLFSEIQEEWVDPSFSPPLAYIPWQDRRGFYTYSNYSDTVKSGPIHDWGASLYTPDFYDSAAIRQERGFSVSSQFNTRADQSLSLTRNVVDYQTGTDDYYDASFVYNASNRFKQFGIEYLFGRQDGMPSHYLDMKAQLRILRRVDLGLEQSVLLFSPDARQTIATLAWQIDPRRAVTGRFVTTNDQTNFFLSYSSSGFTGAETYVILGDPNSPTFSRKISLKFVWAF